MAQRGASGGKVAEAADADTLDFKTLVGSLVNVTLTNNDRVENAEVFAFDTRSRLVVLQTRLPHVVRKRNVRVVRDTFIKKIEYLGREKRTDVNKALPPISYEKLQQREAQAIAKAEEALARIGVGVSTTAQAIFDAVAKMMPCEWDGTDIVIMNNVRVTEPYRQEDCSCKPGQEAARDRIRLILERVLSSLGSA